MEPIQNSAKEIADCAHISMIYSFCTLVTDMSEYLRMVDMFIAKGFTSHDCEFIYADNTTSNKHEAFSGCNKFLLQARGKYIILCHQDIEPLIDDRKKLDTLLAELTLKDPNWGVCGNAGANKSGEIVVRITDPHGTDRKQGSPYPAQVMSLDENFILVRRDANLSLSRDIRGFHWYGADLCIIADVLGWNIYVIDFHLKHKSGGNKDHQFYALKSALRKKMRRAFRPRWQFGVTLQPFYMTNSRMVFLMTEAYLVLNRLFHRFIRMNYKIAHLVSRSFNIK